MGGTVEHSFADQSRVILERHKTPIAVMLDYAQYEKFEAMLELAEDLVLGALARERDRPAGKSAFVDLDRWRSAARLGLDI